MKLEIGSADLPVEDDEAVLGFRTEFWDGLTLVRLVEERCPSLSTTAAMEESIIM